MTSTTAFVFNLDGTITKIGLLPLIATELGLSHEMKVLTEITLKGLIGFEDSFRIRCAALRSLPVSTIQEIVANVPLDEHIVKFIHQNRDTSFVATANIDVWIKPIIDRIGCRAFASTGEVTNNHLVRLQNVLHKSTPINELQRTFERVIAIGYSVNDIPMFEAADEGIAYGNLHYPHKGLSELANYVVFEGGALCRLLSML